MATPTVSVVMPVFNGERFLREAVESILSQTFIEFELIVINDGSTDGTASILDSYTRSDPRVRVYRQENRGLVESLNRGCTLAGGKYLAIMHADDVAVGDRLQRQIEFMEKHPDIGVVGGAVQLIDSAGKAWDCWRPLVENEQIQRIMPKRNPITHSAAMMRKEAFLQAGGYRRLFPAEDYDLWLRIAERWRLANLEAVVAKYRIHPGQATCQKRAQETLCTLAARAFASLRRAGNTEPEIPAEGITPEMLVRLGVDQSAQQRTLAADYAGFIGAMFHASQDDAVIRMVDEMRGLAESGPGDRIRLADVLLFAARSHYRQGRPFRALAAVAQAVVTRPIIVGRPLKLALHSLFRQAQAEAKRA